MANAMFAGAAGQLSRLALRAPAWVGGKTAGSGYRGRRSFKCG